jgi:hypothetical protein
VNGVTLAQPGDELVVVTEDGYGRLLLTDWIDAPPKLNAKPKSIIARRSDIVGIGREGDRVVTSLWMSQLNEIQLDLDDSTKTYPLLDLQPEESVQVILTI